MVTETTIINLESESRNSSYAYVHNSQPSMIVLVPVGKAGHKVEP